MFWEDLGAVVLLVLVIVATIGGMIWYEQASCIAKTENIGFNHRWSILGGCQIEVVSGQWIPLESYYFKQE
jgi:hypothetical protein